MATYVMTAKDFVDKAKSIANLNTVYAYGGLGYHGTAEQKQRMLKAYPAENNKAAIKNATVDTWFFDCVGFIKAILNGFTATKVNPKTGRDYNYGGATFPTSGPLSAKSGAASFFNEYCEHISNDFKNIKIGEAVWLSGSVNYGGDSHIGIYIGDGLVAECTPKWTDGVQITACSNIGTKAGYNARKWQYHGTIPCVNYENAVEVKETAPVQTTLTYTVKKGDNLTKIAKKYGTTYKKIAQANGIKWPYIIRVGQTLIIK